MESFISKVLNSCNLCKLKFDILVCILSGKPEFKYVGNMHGNEVTGRELLLKLMDDLCTRYKAKDPMVTKLIESTSIHILPSMNPDGWEAANALVCIFPAIYL